MELSLEAWDMSNAGRPDYMYHLLCVASDRIIAKDNKGQTTIMLCTF